MSDIVQTLTEMDRQWLNQLEQHALSLFCKYLGDRISLEHAEGDLKRLQSMLDDGEYDLTSEDDLLSFGVILGGVFNAQTSMKWSVVTNDYGRLVAVHDQALGFTLYPVQMIIQRIHDGREVRVLDLYHSFVRDLGIGK